MVDGRTVRRISSTDIKFRLKLSSQRKIFKRCSVNFGIVMVVWTRKEITKFCLVICPFSRRTLEDTIHRQMVSGVEFSWYMWPLNNVKKY